MSAYIRSKVSNSSITDVSIEAENSSATLRQDGSFKLPYASDLGESTPLGSLRYNDVSNRLEFKNPEGWKQVDQFAPEEIVTDAELQEAIDSLSTVAQTGEYSDLLNIPQDIATEGYVNQKIAELINSAPEHLDTLNELAQAIGSGGEFSQTIFGLLDTKLNIAGGTMTGSLYLYGAPTEPQEAATKSYVDSVASGIEVLNSDDVPEGVINLFYTSARATVDARLALVAGSGVVYNPETGEISVGQEVFTTSDVTFKTVSADQFISTSSDTPTINSATTIVLNAAEGVVVNSPLTLNSMVSSDVNALFVDRGTIVFDTVVEGIKLYDGTAWQELATKQYVNSVISNILDNAPGVLDTLSELANAIGNDPNFINTITAGINLKLNSADFNPRFDERFATKTTSQLAEGTNLYHTVARARAAVSAGTGLTYNNGVFSLTNTSVTAGTYGTASQIPVITVNSQGQITHATSVPVAGVVSFGYNDASGDLTIGTADGNTFTATVKLTPFDTADVAEGSNLYFTTDRARQSISAGTGITYDSNAGTVSIDGTIATKQYVDNAVANIVDNAPDLLNTLNELSAAIGDDPNFFSSIGTNLQNEINSRIAADQVLQDKLDNETATRISAINYEGSLRGSADAQLQANIDSEVGARTSADNTLQNNINAEALARTTADTQLQSNIDSEATARANADTQLQANIDSEATARANADTQLQDNLNTEVSRATLAELQITANLSQETQDRIAADNQINSRIDFIEENIDPAALDSLTEIVSSFQNADAVINTAINNEANARISADTQLQNNINAETTARTSADNTLQANINAEELARTNADAALQSDINTETQRATGAEQQITANLSQEISDRMAADNQINSRIDFMQSNMDPAALDSLAEIVSAFQDADNNINNAITSLTNTLTTRIDNEEVARTSADNQLQNNIDSEAFTRANADNTLQNNIDAEELARINADNNLQSNLDIEATARMDADVVLQTNLDTEAQIRYNADALLQSNLNAEATARTNADNTLQNNLDAEANTRAADDNQLQSNIDAEALARTNADNTLQSNINAEASARTNADATITTNLNAEIANRISADNLLNARIDFIEANVDPTALDSLTEIVSAFQNADHNLSNTITALASTLSDRIDTEIVDRTLADSQLQYNLDNESITRQNADIQLQTNISSEAITRANADSILQSNINNEAGARYSADAQLQSNLNSEASARIAADNQLQSNLNSETSARIAADNQLQNNLNTEASVRAAADSTLQANINTEANTRASADALLQSNINNEAAARIAADNQLQSNIDAEESARIVADQQLQNNIDAETQARILRDNQLQTQLDAETRERINADNVLQQNIDDETAARVDADHRLNLRVTTETNARKSADYRLHLRINEEIAAREAESFRAQQAESELQSQLDEEQRDRVSGDASTLLAAKKFTNDAISSLTTDDIEEGTTNRYYSDELVRAGLRSEGSVFFNATNGIITTSGSYAPSEVKIGTNAGELWQGVNAIAIGNNAGQENQGDYSIAIGTFAGMSNLPARSIVLNAQPPLGPNGEPIGWGENEAWDAAAWDKVKGMTPTHSGFYVKPVRPDFCGDFTLHYNPANGEIFYSPSFNVAEFLHGGGSVFFNPWSGLITTAGSHAPSEVKIGRNSGKINQGYNAIAIGNHAGNDSQGDYSIAIGAFAGVNRLPANTIVLNAMAPVGPAGAPAGWDVNGDDWDEIGWDPAAGISPTQSGFYVMPIRQDTFRGFSLHYDPSSGEVVYSSTPDFVTRATVDEKISEAVHNLASEEYVNLAVAHLVDSAPAVLDTLNELAQALGDDPNFATSISNVVGQKLDKAGGILTGPLQLAADPVYANEAATKSYVDVAVSSIPTSSDDLLEGASNLYFTVARSRASISVGGSLDYDEATGVISYTQPELFSGSYNDLTDKPELFNGDYNSLANQPALFSGSYNDLTDKPILFPGDYNSLVNKPVIPTDISELSDSYGLLGSGGTGGGTSEPGINLDGGSYETGPDFDNSEIIIEGAELDVIPTLPVFTDTAHRDREIINPTTGMMIMCGPPVDGDYSVQIYAGTTWRTCC